MNRMTLAMVALKASKWCKASPVLEEALCRQCNPQDGVTVEMDIATLPKDPNLILFSAKPKCSSSRVHLKSQVILVIAGLPGIKPLFSNPISLFSRGLRGRQAISATISTNHTWPDFQSSMAELTLQTNFYVQQSVVYTKHARLPPVTTSVSPSSRLVSYPYQERKRPTVGIVFLSSPNPEKIFHIYRDIMFKFGALACFGFILPGGHLAIIDVCPSLKECMEATYAQIVWCRGQNPYGANLLKPNPYLSVLGWASNTLVS
ncbi:hypothetical protein Pelo_16837 [Pelomyxa schiedti]|nr:hypothetical protein Pelo_16837 [Pelomyxa schiedti]